MSGIKRIRLGLPARAALMATASAIALVGAIVGVVVGGSAPGTARNPITFGVVTPTGSVYVPLTPNRVLDTRSNLGITGKIHNQVAATFQVTGLHPLDVTTNVPTDAVGVTGNLTVTQQSALGYLSLTPEPDQQSNDLDPQLPDHEQLGQRGHWLSWLGRQAERHLRRPAGRHDACRLRRHRVLRGR